MAEETLSPISAPKPPAVNPLGAASAHASTLKLKPVIRKPAVGGAAKPGLRPGLKLPGAAGAKPAAAPAPAAPAASAPAADAPSAMDQLKGMTQKLKGVTQQIPQQAILHKTGIIADESMTEAQKQASKSRTARISLSDAIGAAPVQNDAAPMKTIRIKRPAAPLKSGESAPAASEPAAAAPAAPAAPAATLTQKKTLKVTRPGPKLSVKKPGAAPAPKPASDGMSPVEDEVADIPETTATAPAPFQMPAAPAGGRIKDVPTGLQVFDLILQIAACIAIGYLGYLLYLDCEMQWF